ncbi:MAG: nucleotidyltransferase domain-containing protein [Cyanobacteria bacterium M_surface_7_m2_037]|nr:nucleotidyltransferase domain-containing protein [Cyanobacteria bacterium M_surface_7_m2_037]MBM5818910.1 nucleotidyltransferase domain-containing protein [Cyanobacteria bacterium K_DeepCast_150m_m2_101]
MSSTIRSEAPAGQAQQAIASTIRNSVQTEQNSGQCDNSVHPTPNHGLPRRTVNAIRLCLQQFPQLHWVKLYGSRAMGCHWRGSDIDLAFSADENCSAALHEALDQLPTPYLFDVTHWESHRHSGLREHIERVGIPFPDPQP